MMTRFVEYATCMGKWEMRVQFWLEDKNFQWRREEDSIEYKNDRAWRNKLHLTSLERANLQIFARYFKISVPKMGKYMEQSLNYKLMRNEEAPWTSVYFLSFHLTDVRFTLRKFNGTVSECRKREQKHVSSTYWIVSRWRKGNLIT